MKNNFCDLIDRDNLVEKYVQGSLHGELLNQFVEHLTVCEEHSMAVTLEKVLSRGVREYARSELKTKLHQNISKQETTKYYILRYAAVLIVAIIAPIILYYQFSHLPFVKETPSAVQPAQSETENISADPAETTARQIPEVPTESMAIAENNVKITAAVKSTPAEMASPAGGSAKAAKLSRNFQGEISEWPEDDALSDSAKLKLGLLQDELPDCIKNYHDGESVEFMLAFKINKAGQAVEIALIPDNIFTTEARECITEKVSRLHFGQQIKTSMVRRKITLK